MAVAPSIDVTVHRHGQPALTITGSVVGMRWSHSISAPWQSLTVAWKAAVRDSFLVSVGDWVVVRAGYGDDPRKGPVLAWGHVDDVDGGATMQPNGALMSDTIQLKCSSWWGLLHTVNLYSVTGWADDIGTLLSMETWAKTITSVVDDYQVGSLSKAFQALLSKLAAVKLPSTMVPGYPDATLGDLIPLVHDSDTRDLYAPERIVESVDIGGGLPNQLTSKIPSYESSVGELLSGTFVPEAMLIELFPSFERFPETEVVPQSPPTNPALAKFLGGWETLIYRIKPFRHTPLRESTVAYASYTHTDVEKAVADAMAAFNNATTPLSFLQAVSARNAAMQGLSTRNSTWSLFVGDTAEILKNYFKDRTWGYTGIVDSPSGPKDRKEPYPKWVDKPILRSISINRSDKSRVNASTLAIAPDPSAGSVDAVKTFGLPITYDEEIRRHGLRMLKPTWTFVVPAASVTPAPSATQTLLSPGQSVLKALSPTRDGNYLPYMRSICAQLMQFYKNGHLYATGTMQLNLLEAWRLDPTKSHQTFFNKVLDLKAGHTMAVTMSGSDVFYAYAESVEHNFTVQDGGIQTAATTVSYTRGHFGVEEDALANVAVPMREVTAANKAPPATATTSAPATGSSRRTSTPITDAQRLDYALRIYAYFTASEFSPSLALACVHQTGFESGWNPTSVNWYVGARTTTPAAIGFFQLNTFNGLGVAKSNLASNLEEWQLEVSTKAGTTLQHAQQPDMYWDAEDPRLNCQRVDWYIRDNSQIFFVSDPRSEAQTVFGSYYWLLNSPAGGGGRPRNAQGENREYRYSVGARIFGSEWTSSTFNSRFRPTNQPDWDVVFDQDFVPADAIPSKVVDLIRARVAAGGQG